MNEISEEYLKKVLYWKKLTAILCSIFLVILWIIYLAVAWMTSPQFMRTEEWFVYGIGGIYLLLGLYLNYLLYTGVAGLREYLKNADWKDLERAFKTQRYFWVGLSSMILSLFLLGTLVFFVA